MIPEDQAIGKRDWDDILALYSCKDKRALTDRCIAFALKPDALRALDVVRQAGATGLPLPLIVAEWLNPRIEDLFSGRAKTLDAALGLVSVRGQHSALSREREVLRWVGPIESLHELASLGAAIDDAALLVATISGVGASTLARKYRNMNLELARKVWAEIYRDRSRESIEEALAKYPDNVQSRPVKAAIRAKLKL